MHTIDRILTRIENFIMAAFLFAGLVVGVLAVILRYVFNTGLVWSEGILITVVVWGVLIGGSQAIARGIHARVDVLIERFPPKPRRLTQILTATGVLAYCAFIAYAGALYVSFLRQIGSVSVDTGVPDWITYSIVPISMIAFSLRYLLQICRLARGEDEPSSAHALHPGDLG